RRRGTSGRNRSTSDARAAHRTQDSAAAANGRGPSTRLAVPADGPGSSSNRSNSLSCLNIAQFQGISSPASRIARGWGPGCEVVAGARGRGRRGPAGATGGCARISLDPVSRGATCARRGHYATSRRALRSARGARPLRASAGRLTELYSHGELPLWPHATHGDHVTGVALSQDPAQVARVVQLFVVDVRD